MASSWPEWDLVVLHKKALHRRRLVLIGLSILALLAASAFALNSRPKPTVWMTSPDGSLRVALSSVGQTAVMITGRGELHSSDDDQPAPIASLAKTMTAFLILRDHPLVGQGFKLRVNADDARDTARRRAGDESVVSVSEGEVLTEHQALEALLLPSANNVAFMLAAHDSTVGHFLSRMNAEARRLHMANTRYTDPSGLDPQTVSTAHDQLLLVAAAMRNPVFAALVALPSATIPVAGQIINTDTLLGRNGFVGVKTGSDDAAGGCFAFVSRHQIGSRSVSVIGVVMGQRGGPLIRVALAEADRLVTAIVEQLS